MHIAGKAEPAVFTSADISLYPDSYTLSWTVESRSDVATFLVQFKESRAEKWTSMEVAATPSPNTSWQGTALLSHLQPATQYVATVSTKNNFEYSEPGLAFKFTTKGAGN